MTAVSRIVRVARRERDGFFYTDGGRDAPDWDPNIMYAKWSVPWSGSETPLKRDQPRYYFGYDREPAPGRWDGVFMHEMRVTYELDPNGN